MKNLKLVLPIVIVAMVSCGCPHHPYQALASETSKWTRIYNGGKESLFKDSLNEYDTIAASFKDTVLIWSASAECNFPCQSSVVKMQSKRFNLDLKITATNNNRVLFDYCFGHPDCDQMADYNVDEDNLMAGHDFDAKINLNFSFHGQVMKVMEIARKTGYLATFSKIIYSREFGLIEIVDNQNKVWILN